MFARPAPVESTPSPPSVETRLSSPARKTLILCVYSWSKSFGTALAGLYVVPHGRYAEGSAADLFAFRRVCTTTFRGTGTTTAACPRPTASRSTPGEYIPLGGAVQVCVVYTLSTLALPTIKPPSLPQGEDCRRSPCQTPQTSISADISVRLFFNICCQESWPLNAGLCRSSWFLPSFLPYLRDMVRHRGADLDECLAQCRAPHRLDHATRP